VTGGRTKGGSLDITAGSLLNFMAP
jgi:hypothetical protein